MQTVTLNDFLADSLKYLDFNNFKPFAIVNEIGQRITLAMPKIKAKAEEPAGRMATPEELEMFRIAEEEHARDEYYKKLPGETMLQFLDRINADPVNNLVCNIK